MINYTGVVSCVRIAQGKNLKKWDFLLNRLASGILISSPKDISGEFVKNYIGRNGFTFYDVFRIIHD